MALIPAVSVGVLVGYIAVQQSQEALQAQAESRLVSLREVRANQVESYFNSMRDQVLVAANALSTQRSLSTLRTSFHDYLETSLAEPNEDRSRLADYYSGPFAAEYAKRNAEASLDTKSYLNKLDDLAVIFQQRFINANPNPLGEKDALTDLGDGSEYARLHAMFHSSFREMQQRFGYYDIFLVDGESGHVVYSVFKEVDFATSLKDGPFANSGLGDAFRAAIQIDTADQTAMTDFAPYFPSYEDPAAFIGAPVFHAGRKVGAIIFQLPLDRIQQVMTGDERWVESGLGQSGETYLVGADGKMRSQSRFLLEDPAGYAQMLRENGIEDEVVKGIQAKNTVIGIQSIDTPGSRAALDGQTGFASFADYRGVEVLSAYKPIDIGGHQWAILAEIDAAEAFAAADSLRSAVVYGVLGVTTTVVILTVLIGFLFSRTISEPLNRITASMQQISSGNGDLRVRLDASRKDEIGELSRAFNQFVDSIDTLVGHIKESVLGMSSAAQDLYQVTDQTRKGVENQQSQIEHIATAVEEMTSTVKEVAESSSATATAAEHAGNEVGKGRDVLRKNVESVNHLSSRMSASQEIINALSSDSEKVGTVLEVIRSIAEQTNLLALNAAIEAARAGEQGRGFAVVADEVRVLAQRTQHSTEEIREIIESLQSRSRETTEMLAQNNTELQENVAHSQATQTAFTEIENAVNQLLEMSAHIASATEEQSAATDEIGRNVHVIHQVAVETATGADNTASVTEKVARLGSDLNELVGKFKVSAGA